MSKKSKVPYLPLERDYLEQSPKELKSCSKEDKKSCSNLPSPVEDPIVCNNIAWMEFDYTSRDQP